MLPVGYRQPRAVCKRSPRCCSTTAATATPPPAARQLVHLGLPVWQHALIGFYYPNHTGSMVLVAVCCCPHWPCATAPVLQVKDNGIVLFAYPKANTKGCTSQAVGLSDKVEELAAAGYKVYGISADKPKSQANWRSKEGLAFNLLCDPSYEVTIPA